MPEYLVKWSNDRRDPRSSSWYVLNGVITYASGKLKDWEGRPHRELVAHLGSNGYYVEQISAQCIPPTKKYRLQMKACAGAIVDLLTPPATR